MVVDWILLTILCLGSSAIAVSIVFVPIALTFQRRRAQDGPPEEAESYLSLLIEVARAFVGLRHG